MADPSPVFGREPPSKKAVNVLARNALRAIAVVGGVLVLLFSFLQIKSIPLRPIFEGANPQYLREIVLAVYYFCWVSGTTFDVAMQQAAYVRDPQKGQFDKVAIGTIALLLVVAAVLLWVKDSDERFAAVLAVFVVANIIGWRVLLGRVNPVIAESKREYAGKNQHFALERLSIVEKYIGGAWQWLRFVGMTVVVAASNVVCFSDPARRVASGYVHAIIPDVPVEAIAKLLPVLSLMLFVLFAETWIWLMRASARAAIQTIDRLAERYEIKALPASEAE